MFPFTYCLILDSTPNYFFPSDTGKEIFNENWTDIDNLFIDMYISSY